MQLRDKLGQGFDAVVSTLHTAVFSLKIQHHFQSTFLLTLVGSG